MRVSALRSLPRGPEPVGVEDPEEQGDNEQNRLVERARHRKQAQGGCASKRPGNLAVAREDGHGANRPADQSHAARDSISQEASAAYWPRNGRYGSRDGSDRAPCTCVQPPP